jgi:CRISPR-associated endonuclease/helicase Cas3
MDTFREIVERISVAKLLKGHDQYLAHTPDELVASHMELVTVYFVDLVDKHQLDPLIDRVCLNVAKNDLELAGEIKRIFWETILYHDFGKVNPNFQKKLNNARFISSIENNIDSQHSILSAFIFLMHQYSKKGFPKSLITLTGCFAHNIVRHHSPHLDDISSKKTFTQLSGETCQKLAVYLDLFDKPHIPALISLLPKLAANALELKGLTFDHFFLIRLNFSLLTAADYYATSHYCSKWKNNYQEFGVLTNDQKKQHYQNLLTTQAHNKALFENHEDFLNRPLAQLQGKSNNNLNMLRSKMAAEVINQVRQFSSEKLFYIEAPTGGGKTNMAFIATMELLEANQELNKVFYVFPFTTLITQTLKAAKETMGLLPEEWIELHGKAAWKQKEDLERKEDGLFGERRLDDIHNQFVNYPYTFLSHVRFFDILKANDKSSIYLMHRLANSVVVIDEVQAYNPELWDKMAYLLNEYAEALNIRFIVMSATLPKIGDLAEAHFRNLIPNAIAHYFINPNFAERVSFSDELLERKQPKKEERQEYLNWLMDKIFTKSESYRAKNGQVRTIVEFIFKKSATEFADMAKSRFDDYLIYVLSGTILEPQRRKIIHALKNKNNKSKNILLISTQVVEAGVDIDMDLGFKNRSIIDSEEQLAGRVNRNVNKTDCTVFLFDLDDAGVIYKNDRRYKDQKIYLTDVDYFEILRTKRFDLLYDKVKSYLQATNQEKQLRGTLSEYRDSLIAQLNFPEIDKEFKLIDQTNTTVFVPLDLKAWVLNEKNEKEQIFTEQQIRFLKDHGVNMVNEHLSGEEVFELYKRLISEQAEDFGEKKRYLKILQSIMSMFTFPLFSQSKVVDQLISGGNFDTYGFLYLVSYKEIYDKKTGLLDQKLKDLIFIYCHPSK